jgi:hypothetical protein
MQSVGKVEARPQPGHGLLQAVAIFDADAGVNEQLLKNLEEGMEVMGVVKNLTDYGAFLDRGGIDGLAGRADLFRDHIHLSDLGAYLVALTHYAVLYRQSPVGLPHALSRADGTPAAAPGPDAARLMQELAWATVTAHPRSGVAG